MYGMQKYGYKKVMKCKNYIPLTNSEYYIAFFYFQLPISMMITKVKSAIHILKNQNSQKPISKPLNPYQIYKIRVLEMYIPLKQITIGEFGRKNKLIETKQANIIIFS